MTIPSVIKNPVSIIILIIFLVAFGFIIPRWYFENRNQDLDIDALGVKQNIRECIYYALSTQVSAHQIPPRLFRYSRPESIIPVIALSYKSYIKTDTQIYIILNTYTFFGIPLGEYVYSCFDS